MNTGDDAATPSPQEVALWFPLNLVRIERVPWWAARWLADGYEGEDLRELAGLDDSDPRAIRDLVPLVLAEMQVQVAPTLLAAARQAFRYVAQQRSSGRADERWVLQQVESIVVATGYDDQILDLPLGEVFHLSDAWNEPWGPPLEELKASIRTRCSEQLNASAVTSGRADST
ncbi:hypothetical protein ACQEU3_44775 [Spirillospora sp. CA-253888]